MRSERVATLDEVRKRKFACLRRSSIYIYRRIRALVRGGEIIQLNMDIWDIKSSAIDAQSNVPTVFSQLH